MDESTDIEGKRIQLCRVLSLLLMLPNNYWKKKKKKKKKNIYIYIYIYIYIATFPPHFKCAVSSLALGVAVGLEEVFGGDEHSGDLQKPGQATYEEQVRWSLETQCLSVMFVYMATSFVMHLNTVCVCISCE